MNKHHHTDSHTAHTDQTPHKQKQPFFTHAVSSGEHAHRRFRVTSAVVQAAGVDGDAVDAVVEVPVGTATQVVARAGEHTDPGPAHTDRLLTHVDRCPRKPGKNV